jgi:hypothetical protein
VITGSRLLALSATCATALVGSVAFGADLPLVASHLTTGPASHVQLTNTGSQTVNAWSLAITTPVGSSGAHQVVESVDAYLSESTRGIVEIPDRLSGLLPGQTREIPLDPLPADATVRVLAVVLDDDTAVGDSETIRSIFSRRAVERDELHRVVETFNDVLASGRGISALQELKRRFDVSVPEESTPHRAAREAVESYLRRATAENANQIEQLLRQYAAVVERQYEVAARHSRWITSPR